MLCSALGSGCLACVINVGYSPDNASGMEWSPIVVNMAARYVLNGLVSEKKWLLLFTPYAILHEN